MKTYKDLSGESGIDSYSDEPEGLLVRFKDGGVYLYPGADDLKGYAEDGVGLNTRINETKPRFIKVPFALYKKARSFVLGSDEDEEEV